MADCFIAFGSFLLPSRCKAACLSFLLRKTHKKLRLSAKKNSIATSLNRKDLLFDSTTSEYDLTWKDQSPFLVSWNKRYCRSSNGPPSGRLHLVALSLDYFSRRDTEHVVRRFFYADQLSCVQLD